MNKHNIAILGANSHISKGLICGFLRRDDVVLHLYTTSKMKLNPFLLGVNSNEMEKCVIHDGYGSFPFHVFDVIINCIGVGTAKKLKGNYANWFVITERYDNMVLEYLSQKNQEALYVSFSSGAVYGSQWHAPAEKTTENCIRVNDVKKEDYYGIARLNAEAKHRAFSNLNIVDLRVFSYFSRFIDLSEEYLMAEIINCAITQQKLITNDSNILRDYVGPDNLYALITKCMDRKHLNCALDAISSDPVKKFELLEFFKSEYDLSYEIVNDARNDSATGTKLNYCSNYHNAQHIGYIPEYSSIETIKNESKYFFSDIAREKEPNVDLKKTV